MFAFPGWSLMQPHWLYSVPMTLLHYNSVYLTFPLGQSANHLVAKASVDFDEFYHQNRLAWIAAALLLSFYLGCFRSF